MLTKVRGVAALAFSVALGAWAPSSAKPVPPPAPVGPGFYPCADGPILGIEKADEAACRAKAMNMVRAVRVRLFVLSYKPDQAGCIGNDAAMCLASLSRALVLSTRRYEDPHFDLPAEPQLDINGKPLKQLLMLHASVPGLPPSNDLAGVNIEMADGVHVSQVDFFPANPLRLARTAEEWNATGLYEAAVGVLGAACVGTDKLAFYRRVDAVQRGGDTERSDTGYYGHRTSAISETGIDHVCGKKMVVATSVGHSTDGGDFAGSLVSFENDATADVTQKAAAVSTASSGSGSTNVGASAPALPTLEQWQQGADASAARGGFGFTFGTIPDGGLVMAVAAKGPAASAGLRPGEVIETVNGTSLKGLTPPAAVDLVVRSGSSLTLSVAEVGTLKITKGQ